MTGALDTWATASTSQTDMVREEAPTVDYLILGGGSAGCVLASRLSELPDAKVLLVEAGDDLTAETMPRDVAARYPGRAYFNAGRLWNGLSVNLVDGYGNLPAPRTPYEQGRGLGGCSTINGIGSNRGSPADYDEWAEKGAAGWGWDDVLPYFRKLERDLDFPAQKDVHGADGPWPIRRGSPSEFSTLTRAALEILERDGHRIRDDQNGAWEDGIYPTAVNIDEHGRRATAATAYLGPQVRARSNLAIWCRCPVEKLRFRDGRAVGADVLVNRNRKTVWAREIIVSAGALQTPTLLMRSGIGPASDLKDLGIEVVADRQGVGKNLREHPSIGVSGFAVPAARMAKGDLYHIQSVLRWSSHEQGGPQGDMHLAISARSAWHAIGYQIVSLMGWVNKSYSHGEVRLLRTGAGFSPDAHFNLLSDRRDLLRLAQSFRLTSKLMRELVRRGLVLEAFPSSYSKKFRTLSAPTFRNGALTATAAPLMDGIAIFRKAVLRWVTDGIPRLGDLDRDEARLHDFLRRNVGGVWHASGTARMGCEADPLCVTTGTGRVIGVPGLRVCDASLMPTIPCANTNLPVIMIAEKIADHVKLERRASGEARGNA